MSTCRCGVEIVWVDDVTSPARVPIEPLITLTSGPDRWVVVEYGERWKADLLDPKAPVSGHPDHRTRCPR